MHRFIYGSRFAPGVEFSTKALVVNSSPRMDKGNTALVLNPFVQGMRDSGAQVKMLYSKRLDIRPCTGEFRCWTDSPGSCYIKDDMPDLLAEMRGSEYWVFGVPVYAKFPGEMQNIMNRTMPLFDERVVARGRTLLPGVRGELKLRKIVLVSSCAFWGLENFDLIVETMQFLAKAFDSKLARPLLRPNAEMLRPGGVSRQTAKMVMDGAKKAGSELIADDDISAKSARIVQMPFMSKAEFLKSQ